MKRSFLIVLVVLAALANASQADAISATSSRAFERFEQRVCKAEIAQSREANPVVLRFNLLYNEPEQTPETLQAAGRELRQAYGIYQRFNKRILAMRAPAASAALWKRYGKQQRRVQRLGFQGASALEAADLSSFERIKVRNENWQRQRNATWSRIGFVC